MSTNGGAVWTNTWSYFTDGGDLIADAVRPNVFWTGGRYSNLMAVAKSTDGGQSWTARTIGSGSGFTLALAVDPVDTGVVYAAGYENGAAAVYRTSDGGGAWQKVPATGLSGYVYDLEIDPASAGRLYAGTASGIYRSTDHGLNWALSGAGGILVNGLLINPAGSDTVYAGTQSGVLVTTDGGGAWQPMSQGLIDTDVLCLAINPGNYLFCGTRKGGSYRWSLVGIEEQSQYSGTDQLGVQVTPNPVQSRARIRFSLAGRSMVCVALYDIRGCRVKRLVSEALSAGDHVVAWNGTNETGVPVASGVYFCRVSAGPATHVTKLVLER